MRHERKKPSLAGTFTSLTFMSFASGWAYFWPGATNPASALHVYIGGGSLKYLSTLTAWSGVSPCGWRWLQLEVGHSPHPLVALAPFKPPTSRVASGQLTSRFFAAPVESNLLLAFAPATASPPVAKCSSVDFWARLSGSHFFCVNEGHRVTGCKG